MLFNGDREGLVFGFELGDLGLKSLELSLNLFLAVGVRRLRNMLGVEVFGVELATVGAVVAGEPIEEVVEVFYTAQGIAGADGAIAMGGLVAEFMDEADFVEEVGRVEVFFEGAFVDQCAELGVIGLFPVAVVLVEPQDGLL